MITCPIPKVGGKDLKKKRFRATANERILIHLLDYIREREEVEYPHEITQAGIAEILGTRRSHVSLALSSLKEKGYVEDKLGRVEDEIRRRKVYFLSHKGINHAKELRDNFLRKEIVVPGVTAKVKIGELDGFLGESYFLIDVLSCINSEAVLDLGALAGPPKVVAEEEPSVEPEPGPAEEEVLPAREQKEELVPPQEMAVPYMQVSCPNCLLRFFIQATQRLEDVYTRCPNCLNEFSPYTPPQPSREAPRKEFNPGTFSASVGLMALTILSPLILRSVLLCGLWSITFPLAILLLIMTFYRVGEFTDSDRKFLILGSSFLVFCAIVLVQVGFSPNPPLEMYLVLFSIVLSFLILSGVSGSFSESVQKEIPVVGGLTFLILGLLAASMPVGLPWASQLFPYFILLGSTALIVAHNIGRFGGFTPRAICAGFGFPISISAISWIDYSVVNLDYLALIPAVLWLSLGLLLIAVRFISEEKSKRMIETLKGTVPFSVGAFFIIFGILLLLAFRILESVLPFVVGIPIVKFGIDRPAGSPRWYRIAFYAFSVILTLATLYPVLLA